MTAGPEDYMFRSKLFRNAIEIAAISIVIVDRVGRIVYVNEQMLWLTGRSERDLLNLPVEELLPPDLQERHRGHREKFWETPSRRVMGPNLDLVILQRIPDGHRHVPVHITLAPTMVDDRPLVVCTIQELRTLQ